MQICETGSLKLPSFPNLEIAPCGEEWTELGYWLLIGELVALSLDTCKQLAFQYGGELVQLTRL